MGSLARVPVFEGGRWAGWRFSKNAKEDTSRGLNPIHQNLHGEWGVWSCLAECSVRGRVEGWGLRCWLEDGRGSVPNANPSHESCWLRARESYVMLCNVV